MAEYIEREPMIEEIQRLIDNVSRNFPKATETELIILKGKYEAFMEYIKEQPVADVQPVDTKEILRHLDSLMICVGNAYNTSHYLLESDMEFIEKQEKIIKGLLSNKPIKG